MSQPFAEVFPLIWTDDVAGLGEWAVSTLGLVESWRAPGEGDEIEHIELHWISGKISLNLAKGAKMGASGISLRVDDRKTVEDIYTNALAAGANITQGLEESRVAFSFTATDPKGNQWWVNAETGFLAELRAED